MWEKLPEQEPVFFSPPPQDDGPWRTDPTPDEPDLGLPPVRESVPVDFTIF